MRALLALVLALLLATPASAATRVWGLYGWGDNWFGTSSGVDDIAARARHIYGVSYVVTRNYWETQRVANEIMASPAHDTIVIYGYSCGANAMTVIAKGLAGYRHIHTVAGIQQSQWCGGDPLYSNVSYGQMTYGGCIQTFGLGCKRLEAGDGFHGYIRNIHRRERHGPADTDPEYQQDVITAITHAASGH